MLTLTPATLSIKITRRDDSIFIPLPRVLWRSFGPCSCQHCNGAEGFWDTLALSKKPRTDNASDYTTTVHYPELHV